MGIEGFAKGYDYQDCFSALILSRSFFLSPDRENLFFKIDKKDDAKTDKTDDLKIEFLNKKIEIQFKYSKSRSLVCDDFKNDGELSLDNLFVYDSQQTSDAKYFFILRWFNPAKNDPLSGLLIKQSKTELPFSLGFGSFYKFNLEKSDIISKTFLKNKATNLKKFTKFLSKINIVLESLDFTNTLDVPGDLETSLLNECEKLGAGVYPNANLKKEDFARRIIETVHKTRSKSDNHKLNASQFLQMSGIIENPEIFENDFLIDPSTKIARTKETDRLLNAIKKNELTICIGEPGSGKSYLVKELVEKLNLVKRKYGRYYLYTGEGNDNHSLNIDNLLSNLMSQIKKELKIWTDTFSVDVRTLNNLLSKINEDYLIIIDGVDHLFRSYNNSENAQKFSSLIKEIKTNKFVHVLVLSQPLQIWEEFSDEVFNVSSWSRSEIKEYSLKFKSNFSDSTLNSVFKKSSGNPLYVSYMLKCLENGNEIDKIPEYSGDIKDYYNYLLSDINDFDRCIYFGILSFEISFSEFLKISNCGKTASEKIFLKLLPVLKKNNFNEYVRVYHESFVRYILERCENDDIDKTKYVENVVSWLKTLNFYKDNRAYLYLLSFMNSLGKYEECLEYCNYEFIFNSVKYCKPVSDVKSNIRNFTEAACCLKSISDLFKVCVFNKYIEINHENIFYGLDDFNYFSLFFKIFGGNEFKSNFTKNENYSSKTVELIDNILLLNGESAIKQYEFKHKNEFSDSLVPNNFFNELINQSNQHIKIPNNSSIADLELLVSYLQRRSKLSLVDNTDNRSIQLLINSLSLSNIFDLKIRTYSFDFDSNVYKEKYSERLLLFITYIQKHLYNKKIGKILNDKGRYSFYFRLLNFIRLNKISYSKLQKGGTKKSFESSILKNIDYFVYNLRYTEHFEPRPFDFTSSFFKSIFINQMLLPLKYMEGKSVDYFKSVIEIMNILSGNVRGYHYSCFSLEDLINKSALFISERNKEEIFDLLISEVHNNDNKEIYLYGAQYRFLLANNFFELNRDKSIELFNEGVRFLTFYGDHKDIYMEEVIDAFNVICTIDKDNLYKYSKNLINMCASLYFVTDGKDSTYFLRDAFIVISNIDYRYAIDLIIKFQEKNEKWWAVSEAISYIIGMHYKQLDVDLVYYFVINYRDVQFNDNVLLYLLKKFLPKNLKNVYDIFELITDKEGNCTLANKGYLKINKMIKDFKIEYPLFKKPLRSKMHNRSIENKTPYVFGKDVLKTAKFLDAFDIKTIIDFVEKEEFDEETEKYFFMFLYENKYNHHVNEIADYFIGKIKDDKKSIYLSAVFFLVCSSGYGKMFRKPEFYKHGCNVNKTLFNEYLFKLLSYCEIPFFGFSGLANACYLNNENDAVNKMWNCIFENISTRLPITKDFLGEINEEQTKNKNYLFSKLLFSGMFDDKIYESNLFDCAKDIVVKGKFYSHYIKKYIFRKYKKNKEIFPYELLNIFKIEF